MPMVPSSVSHSLVYTTQFEHSVARGHRWHYFYIFGWFCTALVAMAAASEYADALILN
jgi:hypothetical protein